MCKLIKKNGRKQRRSGSLGGKQPVRIRENIEVC